MLPSTCTTSSDVLRLSSDGHLAPSVISHKLILVGLGRVVLIEGDILQMNGLHMTTSSMVVKSLTEALYVSRLEGEVGQLYEGNWDWHRAWNGACNLDFSQSGIADEVMTGVIATASSLNTSWSIKPQTSCSTELSVLLLCCIPQILLVGSRHAEM